MLPSAETRPGPYICLADAPSASEQHDEPRSSPVMPRQPPATGIVRRTGRAIFQVLNRRYAVRRNVRLGRDVHIGIGTILEAPHQLVVENEMYIGKYCTIEADGLIGRLSFRAHILAPGSESSWLRVSRAKK